MVISLRIKRFDTCRMLKLVPGTKCSKGINFVLSSVRNVTLNQFAPPLV